MTAIGPPENRLSGTAGTAGTGFFVPGCPGGTGQGTICSPSPTRVPPAIPTPSKKGGCPGNTAPERYIVQVRALPDPDGAPGIVRFRRWLKCGLRSFGLRCIAIEPHQAAPVPSPAATARRLAATIPGVRVGSEIVHPGPEQGAAFPGNGAK
jgi:hypothetical protein